MLSKLKTQELKNKRLILLVVLASLIFTVKADAKCNTGNFLNPVTDVCWQCVFPAKIAGVSIKSIKDLDDPPDPTQAPVCVCPPAQIGIPVSFWEPARLVETVRDPFCFPSIGVGMEGSSDGFLGGSNTTLKRNKATGHTFQQAHWMIFPVWGMLDLFLDFPCFEKKGFDIAYISEVDPTWNSDILGFILNPEALLFGNPVAQLACVADSVAVNAGLPLSPLFWCMGSWGSAYPLTGNKNTGEYLNANAALAARTIYKMGRLLALCDPGVKVCGCVQTPIWVKHNYRLQLAKPVRDRTCHPIGRSSLIWGAGKNPPFKGGNFAWMVFRKNACCAFNALSVLR